MPTSPLYLNASVANTFPASIARKYQCVLVRRLPGTAVVASAAALTDAEQEALRFVLDTDLKVLVKDAAVIAATLDEYYPVPKVWTEADMTTYRPRSHRFCEDGTLVVHMHGGRLDCCEFWTGLNQIPPDDPDFAFWSWLVGRSEYAERITERQIPAIKRVWRRYKARIPPNRLNHDAD